MAQKSRRPEAAHPVVADRNNLAFGRQLMGSSWQLSERNQYSPVYAAVRKLLRLADVEQKWGIIARLKPVPEFGRGDLPYQKTNRSGCIALTRGAITVSNKSFAFGWPDSPLVTSRPCIAGSVPTTAKSRPPGLS